MLIFKTILSLFYAILAFSATCWAAPLSRPDKIPPSGSIKINQGSPYTKSIRVTLNLAAQDNPQGSGLLGMKISNNNKIWSWQIPYTTTQAWYLSLRDGTKQVYIKFCDKAKNWSAVYSAKIILDTQPPYFNVHPPKKFKNTNFQVLAGSKDAESAIWVNNQEVIPANSNATWYYEYPLSGAGTKISITAMDKAGNLASKKDFDLKDLDEVGVDPPWIFGYRFDPLTRDFIFNIQDPPGVLSYNIYYANSLSGNLAVSPFILAQANVPVSGTGTTTWRDNGAYTGSHPSQVAMRFYKLEVNRVTPVLRITSISPVDGVTFYEADNIVVTSTVSNPGISLKYQFSVDGVIKRAWSTLSSYTWAATAGRHTIKVEVKSSTGQDAEEVEVYVFRKPIAPPN